MKNKIYHRTVFFYYSIQKCILKSESGFTLIEAVVGGALLLIGGLLLSQVSVNTVIFEKRFDDSFMMNMLLDRSANEVLLNNQWFYPLNPVDVKNTFFVYFGCHDKHGKILSANNQSGIEYSIFEASFPKTGADEDIPKLTTQIIPSNQYFINNKVGYFNTGTSWDYPCEDKKTRYVTFILPFASKLDSSSRSSLYYNANIWVFTVQKDGSIVGGLRERLSITPYI